MAQKINVPMPQDLDLGPSYSVRVTAVDATGAVVSAVKVGPVNIIALPLGTGPLASGPFALIPGPGA